MKQIMLAAVASIALALPAVAETNNNAGHANSQNQTGALAQYTHSPSDQPAANSQHMQGAGNRQAQNTIDPSHLNSQQIRRIQSALDQKGFNVKRTDGKWGPETEAALKHFQQKQKLQGNGQLNRQTLGALGVTTSGQSQGAATTGSGSKENRMNAPSRNPGAMNDSDSNNMGNPGQSPPQANGRSSNSNSESSPPVNDGR